MVAVPILLTAFALGVVVWSAGGRHRDEPPRPIHVARRARRARGARRGRAAHADDRRSSAGAAFVPGLAAALNDVERVTLTKAGGETVATLERRGDAGSWSRRARYRADVAKLRQSLRALADAKILETKTSNPEFYARLGVEDVAEPRGHRRRRGAHGTGQGAADR